MRIQQKDDVMGRQTNTKDVVHGSNGYTYYAYEADRDVLAQVRSEFGGTTLSQYDYVTDAAGRRTEIARSGTAMSETVGGAVTDSNFSFVYDGYLCIQRLNATTRNVKLIFTWDPLEKVATRPLMVEKPGKYKMHVTHDGNKNVSELVFFSGGSGIAAHYEYAPFGVVTASTRSTSVTAYDFRTYNPFRFSSEYADDTLGLVYYNYRHYNPLDGRWTSRDPVQNLIHLIRIYAGRNLERNCYLFVNDKPLFAVDALGLTLVVDNKPFPGSKMVGSLLPGDDNIHWMWVDDDQEGTVKLHRITQESLDKVLLETAKRLCRYEKKDGSRKRDYEKKFDTPFFAGEKAQHQYFYVENGVHEGGDNGAIWADNEINYIGIGMYEAWMGDNLLTGIGLTYGWKLWKWHTVPTYGTIYWLTYGYKRFNELYDNLDPCTCDITNSQSQGTDRRERMSR